jgi:hypothetical protein
MPSLMLDQVSFDREPNGAISAPKWLIFVMGSNVISKIPGLVEEFSTVFVETL